MESIVWGYCYPNTPHAIHAAAIEPPGGGSVTIHSDIENEVVM